jgi:hypothetical protein
MASARVRLLDDLAHPKRPDHSSGQGIEAATKAGERNCANRPTID